MWLLLGQPEKETPPVQAMGAGPVEPAGMLDPSSPDFCRRLQESDVALSDILAAYGSADRQGLIDAYNAYISRSPESPGYAGRYPELYATPPTEALYLPGTVYLTFDDGPSENTQAVLDILAENDIKATFFVVPKADGSDAELLRAIAAAGHTIGIHSGSHVYKQVYESVDSFLDDFAAAYDRIYAATGQKPEIFRFPGGSINVYNRLIFQEVIAEMTRRGFTYYDWNVEGGEKSHATTAATICNTAVAGVLKRERSIVLLHDGPGHQETVKALEPMIAALRQKNYRFARLESSVQPVSFSYDVAE